MIDHTAEIRPQTAQFLRPWPRPGPHKDMPCRHFKVAGADWTVCEDPGDENFRRGRGLMFFGPGVAPTGSDVSHGVAQLFGRAALRAQLGAMMTRAMRAGPSK